MKKLTTVLAIALLLLGGQPIAAARAVGPTDSRTSSPLVYRGGPIMTKAKNYLVFWTGRDKKAFDSKYVKILQQWQKDARHLTVFKATTQYSQANGKRPTDTVYGGTYVDRTPFPTNLWCANMCVGSDDILRIAAKTAVAHKIAPGLGSIVYVYTPHGVRKCNGTVDATRTECEAERDGQDYSGYCGFRSHAAIGQKQLIVVFVNHPEPPCYAEDGRQRFPNGLAVDAAVNLTSNYQMEALTDPLGDGWREDSDDNIEISTECQSIFGPKLPGKKGNSYYGGRTYDVHAMGSNKDHGCVVGSRPSGF